MAASAPELAVSCVFSIDRTNEMARRRDFWNAGMFQVRRGPGRCKNPAEAASNMQLAIKALRSGTCLAFEYEGCERLVEVHTIGLLTTGRPAMNGFQIGGESSSGSVPDWRQFCFDECFDVRLSRTPSAAPRPGYKRSATQFERIFDQL